jgi:hypothetical protein
MSNRCGDPRGSEEIARALRAQDQQHLSNR